MSLDSTASEQRAWANALRWAGRIGLGRRLAVLLAISAALSGIATYVVMSRSSPLGPDPDTVFILLNIDLVLLLLLGAVIARKIAIVWGERRRGIAGARLQTRLVVMFGLLAVTPAIIVALFSTLFFNYGIQAWFSERVRTALTESLAVTSAYLNEHQQNIRADVLAIANDLQREWHVLLNNPSLLNQFVATQAAIRVLPEAMVFDRFGRVLASSGYTFSLQLETLPEWAVEQARKGEVAILTSESGDRVRALIRIDELAEIYLYGGRYVDPTVLNHVTRAEEAVNAYQLLEGRRSGLQITFALIFGVVSLLLLMAAVLFGLSFATRVARPISGLITASEHIREGDLSFRVAEGPEGDEFGTLGRAFNRMTSQIQSQQHALLTANEQLDDRRRFTEAVLAGVSAGVIGLDAGGRINLPNRSACDLLGVEAQELSGKQIAEVIPEMEALFRQAQSGVHRLVEETIRLNRFGKRLTLLVRVGAETEQGSIRGYVVTFDDITDLLQAQRKAAWADVARRIAHEIKNPLTPIQLSAERLRRKYRAEITSDPDVFETCTDTIIRQVGDIGRMVDEFSSFAKMPTPVMREENLSEILRQQVFLQRNANSEIDYRLNLPDRPLIATCDGRQISQAVTNLLQNAADAILENAQRADSEPPFIAVTATSKPNGAEILIEDNGPGLPETLRDRLTEPYVSTRDKGTGLGLAIVKKIMEDHGGDLVLEDRPGGGACMRLVIGLTVKSKGAMESMAETI